MITPTNLAEALDCLQKFLPTDRDLTISSYRAYRYLAGRTSVQISTGVESEGAIRASASVTLVDGKPLSEALFAAEAEHAEKWTAKHARAEYAAAEFGPVFGLAA